MPIVIVLDNQHAFICVCYSAGQVVHNSSNVISFAVVTGNGRLAGTHNGRVTSHGSSAEPTIAVRGKFCPSISASLISLGEKHRLARGVMTTSVAALPSQERILLSQIDLDSSVKAWLAAADETDIVIQASSTGLGEITIPVRWMQLDALAVAVSIGKLVQFRCSLPIADSAVSHQGSLNFNEFEAAVTMKEAVRFGKSLERNGGFECAVVLGYRLRPGSALRALPSSMAVCTANNVSARNLMPDGASLHFYRPPITR